MKYWAYLVAKLATAGGLLFGLRWAIAGIFPAPGPFMSLLIWNYLAYTFVNLIYTLFGVGLVWAIIWDQRYRCRTCLRRLRMPIQRGSWTHVLFGAPHTEYICLYGHGTLNVADLQITGHQGPDWQPHEDMWKELLSLEETKK